VNLQTAKALGINVPNSILPADDVIGYVASTSSPPSFYPPHASLAGKRC
jgi:hypothetical protein